MAHVAVGRRDDRRRPAHDMIAGKERVFLPQAEADMVGEMPRRMDDIDGPAIAEDDIVILQRDIGHEIHIAAFLHAAARLAAAMGAEAVCFCAGQLLQRLGRGGVIAMGMGDQDVGHHLALQRRHQRSDMRPVKRARVDDRDFPLADDIGAGAVKGEGARVLGDHPADHRAQLLRHAIFKFQVSFKRDFYCHDPAFRFFGNCTDKSRSGNRNIATASGPARHFREMLSAIRSRINFSASA